MNTGREITVHAQPVEQRPRFRHRRHHAAELDVHFVSSSPVAVAEFARFRERWPEFFTEDCRYRVTSAENYEAGLPLGLIYATSQNMLRDRVSALRDANIYEPQRYRHLISGIRIEREDDIGLREIVDRRVVCAERPA